jgi:hypothetical protein
MTSFVLLTALACGSDPLHAPRPVVNDRAALIVQATNTDPELKLLLRRLSDAEDVVDDYVAKGFRSDYVSLKVARNKAEIIRKKVARRKREIIEEVRGY